MTTHHDSERLWLLLQRLPDLPNGALTNLQRLHPDPAAILQLPDADWVAAGAGPVALKARRDRTYQARARRDYDWLQRRGGAVLWRDHPHWPPLLREIAAPPPVLQVLGPAESLSAPQLGVVGGRRASVAGRRLAAQLCTDLCSAGFAITSGLALGIDGAAHQAALEAGGLTIAVLGNGLDIHYPRRNSALRSRIAARGVLISEFPLGTPPLAPHFPQRNRLISGLSAGVLVIEAALRSGSLITARLALEQNREVFAVPGSPANPQAQGCNALLRDGAVLVESAMDVLNNLAPWWRPVPAPQPAQPSRPPSLPPELAAVLAQLADHPTAPDLLVRDSGLDPGRLGAALTELELLGLAEREGGAWRRI